jgi:hypothetical protein
MSLVHVHRIRDWWDPFGSREHRVQPWRPGLRIADLVDDAGGEDLAAWRNGARADLDAVVSEGDHVTLALAPAAGAAVGLFSAATQVFLSLGGTQLYKALTFEPPVPRENRDSQTYDWSGIQTAYDAKGLAVPLAYGAPRLGGIVAQRSVRVIQSGGKPRSILYLLLELGLGPFEEIAGFSSDRDFIPASELRGVEINGNPAPNLPGVTGFVRLGTPSQEPIPGFNAIEVTFPVDLPVENVDPPATDWTQATAYTLAEEAQAALLTFALPFGLYAVDGNGNLQTRSVELDVRYRTVDALGAPTSAWLEDAGNPHVVASDLQGTFRHQVPITFETPGGFAPGTLGKGVAKGGGGYLFRNSLSLTRAGGGFWTHGFQVGELTFGGWVLLDASLVGSRNWFGGWYSGSVLTASQHLYNFAPGTTHRGFAIQLRQLAPGDVRVYGLMGDGTSDALGGNVQLGAFPVNPAFGQVAPSAWAHVAVSFKRDGIAPGVHRHRLYVNGQVVDERATSIGLQIPTGTGTRLRLSIVDDFIPNPNWEPFTFDDVFYLDREITPAEVAGIWLNGQGREVSLTLPGLSGLWRFENNLNDAGPFVQTLDTSGSTTYVNGKVSGGASDPTIGNLARYEIQVQRRSTPTSEPTAQDEIRWENVVAITFDEIAYRNRALLGLIIESSEQLAGQQPNVVTDTRARRGLLYDKTSGFWVEAWTQNPAWIAASFATDKREGLGRFFGIGDLDADSFLDLAERADFRVLDRIATASVARFEASTLGGTNTVKLSFAIRPPTHWVAGVAISMTAAVAPGVTISQGLVVSSLRQIVQGVLLLDAPSEQLSGLWECHVLASDLISSSAYANLVTDGAYDFVAASGSNTVEGMEPRFQCDIVADGRGVRAWDHLVAILQTARAMPVKVGSKLRVKFSADRPPTQLFGPDSIVAGSFQLSRVPPAGRFNRVSGEILDRRRGFARRPVQVDHPSIEGPEGVVSVVAKSLELRGVTRASQARRDLTVLVNESALRRLVFRWRSHFDAIGAEIGDLVLVSHPMPVFGFAGLVMSSSPTADAFRIDKPVVLAASTTYRAAVMSTLTDQLYTAEVASPAGSYSRAAVIELAGDLVDELGNAYTPAQNDLWAIGRLETVVREVELLSISTNPTTLERDLVGLEWNAAVVDEDGFPEPLEDSGSELVAPPDPDAPPLLAQLSVADASSISDQSGALETGLAVQWQLDRAAAYLAASVEVFARRLGDSQAVAPVLLATGPADAGRLLVRSAFLRPFERYEILARAVGRAGQKEPLAVAKRQAVLVAGQIAQPDAPSGVAVRALRDQVSYHVDGARRASRVELRRGLGWTLADPIVTLSGDQEAHGPTRDFVALPANGAGRKLPDVVARYVFGRGMVSRPVSTAADYSAQLQLGATVVAVSIEDEGWATGAAVLDDVVATTYEGESVLELDPAMAAGPGSASYATRYFDAGRAKVLHVSAIVEARQLFPLPMELWPELVATRRGTHWDLIEGPTDPADPLYGRIEKVVEIRFSTSADPSTGTWQRFRPGLLRCRSFQLRVTFTRGEALGGNEWNVRVHRFAVQANDAAEVNAPSAIDGGTF